jgi:hypothetical protein
MSQVKMDSAGGLGLPQGAVAVNHRVWFQDLDGNRAVFVDQTPFYCYALDDVTLSRFSVIQLVETASQKSKTFAKLLACTHETFLAFATSFAKKALPV